MLFTHKHIIFSEILSQSINFIVGKHPIPHIFCRDSSIYSYHTVVSMWFHISFHFLIFRSTPNCSQACYYNFWLSHHPLSFDSRKGFPPAHLVLTWLVHFILADSNIGTWVLKQPCTTDIEIVFKDSTYTSC